MIVPEKTIERLSKYRRVLINLNFQQKDYIYSHELANLIHITPEQVRRDMMLIGHSGTLRRGYEVKQLIEKINSIIDGNTVQYVTLVGVGNLGRAMLNYLKNKNKYLQIIACFDNDQDKINKMCCGIPCYSINEAEEQIKKLNINIAILTAPTNVANEVADILIKAGIKGLLNFTTMPLKVPSNVYLEEYDMITSLEKVAYFTQFIE
jgi:redox-sensing transcriptional repressor